MIDSREGLPCASHTPQFHGARGSGTAAARCSHRASSRKPSRSSSSSAAAWAAARSRAMSTRMPPARSRSRWSSRRRRFTTCPFSNLYVGGFRSPEQITHDFGTLAREGVRVVKWASAIDATAARAARRRLGACPTTAWWSRPASTSIGIVPGYSEPAAEAMPHAWKAGRADAAADQAPRRDRRTATSGHHRAAQSVSLPARPLRARLDVRAFSQGRPQALEDPRPRPEAPSPSRHCSRRAGSSSIPA